MIDPLYMEEEMNSPNQDADDVDDGSLSIGGHEAQNIAAKPRRYYQD